MNIVSVRMAKPKSKAPAAAPKPRPQNTEIPRIETLDGLLRPAWKTVEIADTGDGDTMVVYYVRPGSPIMPCVHCWEKVIPVNLVRGDERKTIWVEDDYTPNSEMLHEPRTLDRPSIPAHQNPMWAEFYDQFYPRHRCNEYNVLKVCALQIAVAFIVVNKVFK